MKNGDALSRKETPPAAGGDTPLSRRVKEIYASMLREGISEMEIKEDGVVIFVRRAGPGHASDSPSSSCSAPSGSPSARKDLPESPPAAVSYKNIASPISGVFYRSSSPKSPPFVSEGDTADAGRTLCIVEAMKVMNEIKADSRLKIVKILVDNGAAVSQGQPLFAVE